MEVVAIAVVLARDVAGEGVSSVRPPEARAVVGIVGENLLGQGHASEGLHGEIAVQQVPLLGPILEEEAVAARLVADAIAHEQMVGAVKGDPAVVGVPDARAEHAAAAHGVAHEVEVDRVFTEHAVLAQMPELRVAEAARGVAVIQRVPAHAGGFGGLDDDIAREVGDFATRHALALVRLLERTIQGEHRAGDGREHALLRAHRFLATKRPFLKGVTRLNGLPRARGDDDAILNAPTGHGLLHRHSDLAGLDGRGELQPGAFHRRAMRVPAPAARDDGGQGFRVRAFEMTQPDGGLHARRDGRGEGPDFEHRHDSASGGRGGGIMAVEPVLRRGLTGFHLDEADVEQRGDLARERELPGDVKHPQRGRRFHIIGDDVSRADLNKVPRTRRALAGPSPGVRPVAALRRAGVKDHRSRREDRRREQPRAKSREELHDDEPCPVGRGHFVLCTPSSIRVLLSSPSP